MMDPIFDIFREEAREHLGALEKSFLDLEAADRADARQALINNLFRHAHTLKGDAKVVGLTALQQAAQVLEDVLDELRSHPEKVDRAAVDRGLAQFDKVRQAFEAWQARDENEPEPTDDGEAAQPAETPAAVEAPPPEPPRLKPAPVTPPEPRSGEPVVAPFQAEESFTVRVPSERLDRMLSTAGEVRISQRSALGLAKKLAELREHLAAMLKGIEQQSVSAHRQALEAALDQVRRIDSQLRKKRGREELLVESLEADIRQARLLPLVMLTDSLRRAVRDLAQSLGKAIQYETDVGTIMLDKAVIEALKDPLLHLIRNAADHGLETPAERRAAGKPEEGTIRISASQRGQLVKIQLADDGRGINYARIRERLRQMGEVSEADLREMPEPELVRYLFKPGFSTAPTGAVSGRGVGLDVVQDTVRRLQGTVELESSSSAGTTFVLTVPVTVSTVRILTVLVGNQYYGVPSTAIVRTGRAKREELRELEGSLVLPVDGEPLRWVHLGDLLGGVTSQQTANGQAWSYLLLAQRGQRTAVAVDDLEDEAEVLLKPLGFPLNGLPSIVGATIRADGSVQLVVDLSSSVLSGVEVAAPRPRTEERSPGRILVADDSPTTRAVLRNVFTAAGYLVRTATDGVDALEQLRTQPVDLVVSDVEMPRLNGFDLTRTIKAKFGIPVILVTAKEKEEHRREGLEAGADAYVVKSTFQDRGLLDIVRQFV